MLLHGPLDWVLLAAGAAGVLVGFVITLRALFHDRARGRERCPRCWYELAKASNPAQCPECGHTARKPRHLLRTRRHYRVAAAGVLVLLLGLSSAAYPFSRNNAWHRWLPDTALIAILPHVDADWPIAELDRRFGIGAAEEGYIGQYTDHFTRMWRWQWRLLAVNSGKLAASHGPLKRRQNALVLLLQDLPDPSPAAPSIVRCLEDPDPKMRWLAAWGTKATRYAYLGEARAQMVSALERLRSDRDARTAEAADLALKSFAFPPAHPDATSAQLTPERVETFLRAGNSATLATIYTRLNHIPHSFFWPFGGESSPYRVESLELEIDGHPGVDRALLIADPHGVYWDLLVWLRREDDWRFGGVIHLGGNPLVKPRLSTAAGPAAAWLLCRKSAGHTGDGSYLLQADLWFAVQPGRIRLVASLWSQGHNQRESVPAPGNPVNWGITSASPRVMTHRDRIAIEYDVEATFTASRMQTWRANAPAPGELFRKQVTVRLLQSPDGSFKPDPATPWADQEAFGRAILGTADEFLAELLPDLLDLARRGTDDHRRWLGLFLEQCADSPARRTLQAELAIPR
jgi:hypothetical protein